MKMKSKKIILSSAALLSLPFMNSPIVYAAKALELSHQKSSVLRSFIAMPTTTATQTNASSIQEVSRSLDFNQTLHVRVRQVYLGHPIWGGDAVVHIPHGANIAKSLTAVAYAVEKNNGFMNGTFYQNLNQDLMNTPAYVFNLAQAQKILDKIIQKSGIQSSIKDKQAKLIVYIDNKNKAHWAYDVRFSTGNHSKPIYIVDATTFHIYKQFNEMNAIAVANKDSKNQTKSIFNHSSSFTNGMQSNWVTALGGGIGGNERIGKLTYDGLPGNLGQLSISRNNLNNECYLQNNNVEVIDNRTQRVMSFFCSQSDPTHNNLFWNYSFDTVNGGYSPGNDVLYGSTITSDMYQKWYNVPVLSNLDGTPKIMQPIVHWTGSYDSDNAYGNITGGWYGDGVYRFYPLTSLDIVAYILSLGFTMQHSNLTFDYSQSGAINSAFASMAAQAVQFYVNGRNSWLVGAGACKTEEALYYMDQPSRDCKGQVPGTNCSIDYASQYTYTVAPQHASGVYRRAFYLISNSPGWDTKKAFDIMVQANRYYWLPMTDFQSGACGVMNAVRDFHYEPEAVKMAFALVGIDTSRCNY